MPHALHSILNDLASNLYWTWDDDLPDLWREMDPKLWEICGHNPTHLLQSLPTGALETLSQDKQWVDRVHAAQRRQQHYLSVAADSSKPLVAYFSLEVGLHHSLPLYSGGLGVLAGDHIRSASDLQLPLTGLSLFYRDGYFHQRLVNGKQVPEYHSSILSTLPIEQARDTSGQPVSFDLPIGTRCVHVEVLKLWVGRVRLLLLNTDLDGNDPEDRALTHRLYSGGETRRIAQEVLLGLGGIEALHRLDIEPDFYHLNEGHCAFVTLGLIDKLEPSSLDFSTRLQTVRRQCLFTTHTPVPAGHDRFKPELVEHTLGAFCHQRNLSMPEVLSWGHESSTNEFCMTVAALRGCEVSNGVSKLHGEVSRKMWSGLFIEDPTLTSPITHITNGVHTAYWVGQPARNFFDEHLPGWRTSPWLPEVWSPIHDVPSKEIWEMRGRSRQHLLNEIRHRTGKAISSNTLIIGFARRFASYKRAALLFHHQAQLRNLLMAQPYVHFVFAGKAHPNDQEGQSVLSEVVSYSEDSWFGQYVTFLEDYDMRLGKILTGGCDVWLNNPLRPREASGTSGQKVIFNGGLNLSILDGWWEEGFNQHNGWSIPTHTQSIDFKNDVTAADASQILDQLEKHVLPLWQDRNEEGTPEAWIAIIRNSIQSLAPTFNSHRMVREYMTRFYKYSTPSDPT